MSCRVVDDPLGKGHTVVIDRAQKSSDWRVARELVGPAVNPHMNWTKCFWMFQSHDGRNFMNLTHCGITPDAPMCHVLLCSLLQGR